MSESRFDFESGDLCLDFSNTNDWHASPNPRETLNSFSDLAAWGEEAGLLSRAQAAEMLEFGQAAPEAARQIYEQAIQLREAIYRIFTNRYAGKPMARVDLGILNGSLRQALTHLEVAPEGSGFAWTWAEDSEGSSLVAWGVARAAAELLTSARVERVRECEDDRGCGYLFIDQSKNHSRRWCSMESCGNRAKARRHYARTQSAP